MFLTILKWTALVGIVLGVLYLPFKYVGDVRTEAYESGYKAGLVECDTSRVLAAQAVLKQAEETLQRESEAAQKLATELAKQRRDAGVLKGKLDEALKKQPEAVGCVLNDDVADILRHAANGDFTAAEQQDSAISGTDSHEVPSRAGPHGLRTN